MGLWQLKHPRDFSTYRREHLFCCISTIKKWTGSHTFIDLEKETSVVQLPHGRRIFNSTHVKPWEESDLNSQASVNTNNYPSEEDTLNDADLMGDKYYQTYAAKGNERNIFNVYNEAGPQNSSVITIKRFLNLEKR